MRRGLVAIALTLGLAACTVPLASRAPVPAEGPLPSAATLRSLIEGRRQSLHSLRAEAHIKVAGAARSGSARQVLLIQRPDQLRVEVLSLFGSPFVLTTANGRLAAYVRDENRLYRGPATPSNLAQYAGVTLTVPDVVELLLGNPPPRAVKHASVFYDPSTRQIRLRQETPAGAQVVAFSGSPLVPVAVEELDRANALLWRAEFGEYELVDGTRVPHSIHFELPHQNERVDIELQSPELNPTLAQTLFALTTPPGSEEVRLDGVAD